jgi:hypothetical protein
MDATRSGGRQGIGICFFSGLWAHFLRLRHKKPGYPGLRYRSGPGALRRGRFAPLLSLARAKKRPPCRFFAFRSFALRANSQQCIKKECIKKD